MQHICSTTWWWLALRKLPGPGRDYQGGHCFISNSWWCQLTWLEACLKSSTGWVGRLHRWFSPPLVLLILFAILLNVLYRLLHKQLVDVEEQRGGLVSNGQPFAFLEVWSLQATRCASWEAYKLTNWQADKLTNWQIYKLSDWHDDMMRYHNIWLKFVFNPSLNAHIIRCKL